jgi:guanine deaminase
MSALHLGTLAHLKANPFVAADALEIVESGALLVDAAGRIVRAGARAELAALAPEAEIVEHGASWLLPGLVDGHIHFPQHYATAAYGRHLLDWLDRSILPAETAYADAELAERTARRFVRRLLACGTTTALAFGSQFLHANLSLFDAAAEAGLRLIAGMTLMDLGGPEILLQSVESARDHAETLIARCRGESLLRYAVTPRYALSCSPEMMELCADLLKRYPETYLQTHINESRGEIEAVMAHYADCRDYLEVYERFGLVTERTVLAHDIHVSDAQLERLARARCAVCHCPSSNLYLGSGLFPLARHIEQGVSVCMGTDIGAGTRFSLWENLSDAYKIQQLQGYTLDAARLLYLGTLAGAESLRLSHETGNFAADKRADFLVLNPDANPYLGERLERCANPENQLFCLLHLATEREIEETYVGGKRVYRNSSEEDAVVAFFDL